MDVSILSSSVTSVLDCVSDIYSQNYYESTYNLHENRDESKFSICSEFMNITKQHTNDFDYLTMLEKFEEFSRMFNKYIKLTPNASAKSESDLLLNNVINEIKTWNIMHRIYDDRFKNSSSVASNVCENFYSETVALEVLFTNIREIREAHIVVEWLEGFMKEHLENNSDFILGSQGRSWEHTKTQIKKNRDYISILKKNSSDLDPDAPLRGRLNLNDTDKIDESEYFKYLFNCLKANELDKAYKLCQSHEELWRILTLGGNKFFDNPLFKMNSQLDQNMISVDSSNDVVGNANRELFIKYCNQICEDPTVNIYERSIYALFAGNLKVLSSLDKEDWNHNVWCYFKVFVMEHINSYLHTKVDKGYFESHSIFGNLNSSNLWSDIPELQMKSFKKSNSLLNLSVDQLFDALSLKLKYNLEEIIDMGYNSQQSNQFYQSTYHFVQKCIISNDIEKLVDFVPFIISKLPSHKTTECDKQLLRFLAHVIIFVYSVHFDLNVDIYHSVLESYIHILIESKCMENIIYYISKLPVDLQVKWFTLCLLDVVDKNERMRCIREANEFDLPIVKITNLVCQNIRLNGYQSNVACKLFRCRSSMNMTVSNDNSNRSSNVIIDVCELDRMKIDGLNWLTYNTTQQCYLLRQVNALCREFLQDDKFQAAKMAMGNISNIVSANLISNKNNTNQPKWLENALYEYDCINKYLECMEFYSDWYTYFNRMRPGDKPSVNADLNSINTLSFEEKQRLQKQHETNQIAVMEWQNLVEFYAERFTNSVVDVLKMSNNQGWLANPGDSEMWQYKPDYDCDQSIDDPDTFYGRCRQFDELRHHCLVKSIFMSLSCLMDSNLSHKAYNITEVIADEDYGLFELFNKKQLEKLLSQLRLASINSMENGYDCVGVKFDE